MLTRLEEKKTQHYSLNGNPLCIATRNQAEEAPIVISWLSSNINFDCIFHDYLKNGIIGQKQGI